MLRLLPGINPYASAYTLAPDSIFVTPQFIFSLSRSGVGTASRHLQDWARRYQLKDGMGDRLTLLNNWENTGFDFNGKKLATLMREAKTTRGWISFLTRRRMVRQQVSAQ